MQMVENWLELILRWPFLSVPNFCYQSLYFTYQESFRKEEIGVVRKFRNKLVKHFPHVHFKILKFIANLMTGIRLKTVNKIAKSKTQALRGRKKMEDMASD